MLQKRKALVDKKPADCNYYTTRKASHKSSMIWWLFPNPCTRRSLKQLTNHSLWPCRPSWLSLLTATTIPEPGLDAVRVRSSIHPLNTEPKPPSPTTLSGRKFLVAALSSLKLKLFKLEDCKMSTSVRGVRGTEAEDRLLEPLNPFLSLLTLLQFTSVCIKSSVSCCGEIRYPKKHYNNDSRMSN